jgi:hypothetical protein
LPVGLCRAAAKLLQGVLRCERYPGMAACQGSAEGRWMGT